MDWEPFKRAAAAHALTFIRPNMRVGLGTGSTARHLVELLGAKVRNGLTITAVPTSEATRRDAESAGIPLITLDDGPELDLTIDGADEIAPDLTLIKGGGGALLREKIVAYASKQMIVIADETKCVPALGRFPLPIEIVRFGAAATLLAIIETSRAPEGAVRFRQSADGHRFVTDEGHFILDARLERIHDPAELAARLNSIPGVVEHGLFNDVAVAAVVSGPAGVRVLERPSRT